MGIEKEPQPVNKIESLLDDLAILELYVSRELQKKDEILEALRIAGFDKTDEELADIIEEKVEKMEKEIQNAENPDEGGESGF